MASLQGFHKRAYRLKKTDQKKQEKVFMMDVRRYYLEEQDAMVEEKSISAVFRVGQQFSECKVLAGRRLNGRQHTQRNDISLWTANR